ncbi:MAG: hypothetical protein J0M29_21415 [Chitinophagales bacterium]|nr:hypothetical protein [Chitinophagales bacterium]
MTDAIQRYFLAEKIGGQVAVSIGVAACSVGGGVMLSAGAPFYTGLAIPLVVVGIIQIMVGATVARRSDFQAMDLEKLLDESPAEFRSLESPRMAAVLRNFIRLKWGEVAFITVGLAVILVNDNPTFPKGLGAGLFAQGLISLVFDFFAEKRAKVYANFINKIA